MKIILIFTAFLLAGCAVATPTAIPPTETLMPTATDTPAPPRATETPKVIPVVTAPTETPTVTPTPILWTPEPAIWPTPTGMTCEIEQQWGRGVNHDYEYGCFAVTCWFADGSIYGNNLACVNPAIGTPWPYKWFFYHPLMDSIITE